MRLDPWSIWRIAVALRSVEVNTKTGFGLTAGSYSIRSASSQRGNANIANGATTGNSTVSAVTLANTIERACGSRETGAAGPPYTRTYLTTTTNMRVDRGYDVGRATTGQWEIMEFV
jgi:hypothetical protein